MASAGPPIVLHYTGYDDDRGGIVTLIRHLAAEGRSECVWGANPGARQERGPALPALALPRMEGERIGLANGWRARAVARAVRTWLAESPRRIFHGHSRAGLLVALWLRFMGERRVVVTVHCYGRQRWFYRWAKGVLGSRMQWLTPAMKRYYEGGADSDWSDCVPNGLPGTPASAIRAWPGGRPLRIGGAGQLTANKRWHLVLAALAKLPAGAAVEFRHVGAPAADEASVRYARELQASAVALGLGGRVRWLGWQSSSAGLLREVDVIVVPFHQESFSMIALEALYAGVPVIAARGGGPDDLIKPGENGWLVPPEDAGALARQIGELLEPAAWTALHNDPAHLRRFGSAEVAARWAEIYAGL